MTDNGNTAYVSKKGDTWSGIAFKAYGDVSMMDQITAVNPYHALHDVLPDGLVILVPIIERPSVNALNLPPWKR